MTILSNIRLFTSPYLVAFGVSGCTFLPFMPDAIKARLLRTKRLASQSVCYIQLILSKPTWHDN